MKESGVTFDAATFSEQDLRAVLNRALRNVLVAGAIGIPVIWFAWGWRSMLLFVVGSAIAATGILEWRQLMAAVLARFDVRSDVRSDSAAQQDSVTTAPVIRPIRGVVFWFVIRLVAVAGLLYVSLRSLEGKVAALLLGLALALLALFIEAIGLLRTWST